MRARNQMRALQMMLRLVPLDEYDLRATVCINSLVLFPVFIYEFYTVIRAHFSREKRGCTRIARAGRWRRRAPRRSAPWVWHIQVTRRPIGHRPTPHNQRVKARASAKTQVAKDQVRKS